eukprot:TRINITY_DN47470_c0_g1_i1.p1 TRINITY_DN47470_c0_g1~~TRINITY_DN47470_c0_g1_i1.p1  ORF type:complete len:338 (-),score=68.84 TRINITY_DN47470_c0_g1_i1:157-1170(-)
MARSVAFICFAFLSPNAWLTSAEDTSQPQKRRYFESVLGMHLPSKDAALDCLVPFIDRARLVNELNSMLLEWPPVFQVAELFGQEVDVDMLIKGTMIAKDEECADEAKFEANYAWRAHQIMPKLVRPDSHLDCLVGPAYRADFVKLVNEWASGKDIIHESVFDRTPPMRFHDFVRETVDSLDIKLLEKAARAAAQQVKKDEEKAGYKLVDDGVHPPGWYYLLPVLVACCVFPFLYLAFAWGLCRQSLIRIGIRQNDDIVKQPSERMKLNEPDEALTAILAEQRGTSREPLSVDDTTSVATTTELHAAAKAVDRQSLAQKTPRTVVPVEYSEVPVAAS